MEEPSQYQPLQQELNDVYKYLMRKGISNEDAQDAVQEAAYKYLLYYDSINVIKIKSWLMRVALNFYYDQYRKNKNIQLDFQEHLLTILSKDSIEDYLLTNEKRQDIEKTFSKLKSQHKELIQLKYISGLTYEEIASLLDMKTGTVKTTLARARKKFIQLYRRLNNE